MQEVLGYGYDRVVNRCGFARERSTDCVRIKCRVDDLVGRLARLAEGVWLRVELRF